MSTLTVSSVVVGDDDVGDAVAGQVGHRRPARAAADGEGLLHAEGAVAVAQEHAHGVAAGVGRHEVGPAVAVEVGHRHGGGRGTDGHGLPRLEGAVAVAQLHGHRSPAARRLVMMSSLPSPLRSATATEYLFSPSAERDRRPEGAVAVAHQDVDGAGVAVADDQVELAVAVQVRHRHRGGAVAGGEGLLGPRRCRRPCPSAR